MKKQRVVTVLQMGLVGMWALLTGPVKMQQAATQWEHLTIQLETLTDSQGQPAGKSTRRSACHKGT